MNKDIFINAIKQCAEKYVKDNVIVEVYKNEPIKPYSKYTLQLNYSNFSTFYELDNRYIKDEGYIMRVVSDLCHNIAKMTQRERNCFFKRSDE